MSVQKYHVPYIDGSGKRDKSASIPQHKAKSAQLMMEAKQDVAERERQLEEQPGFVSDMMLEADAKEQYADQQLAEAAAAQAATDKRASELDVREADISAKAKKQDEREKEFQKWEDALTLNVSLLKDVRRQSPNVSVKIES